MNKKIAVLTMLMISSATTSFAFDLGSAIGGFNSVKAEKNDDKEYVDWFRNKIDRDGDIFITPFTLKARVQDRFEKALKINDLTPGTTLQYTPPLELKVGETTLYEVWKFGEYSDKNADKKMNASRYFIFCDKNLLGFSSNISYDIDEDGKRVVDSTSLSVSAFTTNTGMGTMAATYKKICESRTTQAATPASSASAPEAKLPQP